LAGPQRAAGAAALTVSRVRAKPRRAEKIDLRQVFMRHPQAYPNRLSGAPDYKLSILLIL